jgi:hypothetical protein
MSLIAKIEYYNFVSTFPDQNGGQIDRADVYITIVDTATGQPANGNTCEVTYRIDDNGSISTSTAVVIGQSLQIYSGTIRDSRYNFLGEQTYNFYINFYYESITPGSGGSIPPSAGICDLAISFINIDSPETAPGANDGKITVNATSSHLPIEYSLNDVTYQQSAIFTGLSGGLKTIYARDANGCHAQQSVEVRTISSLLISDPSVTLPDGNVSRWNAAFNPIVFTYQRKDFGVISVSADSQTGYAALLINTSLYKPQTQDYALKQSDNVYVNAGPYKGVFEVERVDSTNTLIIRTAFAGNAGGFINIDQLRAYYKVFTRITYFDKLTGLYKTIKSTNRPDGTGLVKADISNFLQSLLSAKDESNYTQINFRDDNLSASYQVAYAEEWDDGDITKTSAYIPLNNPFYVLYAAKQLGERYGGNLAAYVPFSNLAGGLEKAKWVTDFAEPAYSNGYPFDIGFIYGDDLAGRNLYCRFTLLDINRNPLPGGDKTGYLQNEDGSWLLNTDGSRLVIARQSFGDIPIPQQIGLNRLLLNSTLANDVYYIKIELMYDDEHTTHIVTQSQIIRVDDAVNDQCVYLRWIGLTGSWNYYRFVYNQEVSLDVQNAVIIKNYVSDWENQDGIEEVISKTAGPKIKVMAEDLSVADIKGLQSIKYSPKVQMLVNKNPVKWQTIVINTATYNEYETRNGQAPFSITFNMPAINIQTQ